MNTFDCFDNVVYLEADINYTIFHFNNGKKSVFPITLKQYAGQETMRHFLRIHRSFLLNPQYITGLRKDGDKVSIQMINGKELAVSRRKKPLIKHLKKQTPILA